MVAQRRMSNIKYEYSELQENHDYWQGRLRAIEWNMNMRF